MAALLRIQCLKLNLFPLESQHTFFSFFSVLYQPEGLQESSYNISHDEKQPHVDIIMLCLENLGSFQFDVFHSVSTPLVLTQSYHFH